MTAQDLPLSVGVGEYGVGTFGEAMQSAPDCFEIKG